MAPPGCNPRKPVPIPKIPTLPPNDEAETETVSSGDPNEKLGPAGFGAANFLAPGASLPYRIKFENFGPGSVDGNGAPFPSQVWASAPAQEVVITDTLSPALDWSTLRFTGFGFGDALQALEPPRSYFETILPVTIDGKSFEVHFEASLDLATGRVRAVFRSMDPQTSLPPDVLTGFLPPEDGTGRGQGFIEYTVAPRAGMPTGTQIRNVALISFDRQSAISTDQVDPLNPAAGLDPAKQALVTIDAGAPTSRVEALPEQSGRSFEVAWSGTDDTRGSGIVRYDLFVSTNGSPFALWLQATNAGVAVFEGDLGNTYRFYSVARDGVGNSETAPSAAQAVTTVSLEAPVLAGIGGQSLLVGNQFSLTNLLARSVPGHEYAFSLDGWSLANGVQIHPTTGFLTWTPDCRQGSSTNRISVWVTDTTWTNLSDVVTFTAIVRECVEPTLGQLILPAGQRGRLPVNLLTSERLTNLSMMLHLPTDRLSDPAVEVPDEATNVVAAATLALVEGRQYQLGLAARSGTWMTGTQQMAWLYVSATTNQPSGFAYVSFDDPVGTLPDGTLSTVVEVPSQRVVILGCEPLLEATVDATRQPALILYARRGTTNLLEYTAALSEAAIWTPAQPVVMTNLMEVLQPDCPADCTLFFRARQE